MNIQGTPSQPRPFGQSSFDETLEAMDEPHMNLDDVSAQELQEEIDKNPKRAAKSEM